MNRLDSVDSAQLRTDIPAFAPGDTVRVHVRSAQRVHLHSRLHHDLHPRRPRMTSSPRRRAEMHEPDRLSR